MEIIFDKERDDVSAPVISENPAWVMGSIRKRYFIIFLQELPATIRQTHQFCGLNEALGCVHRH
jgi:hypothetical protein